MDTEYIKFTSMWVSCGYCHNDEALTSSPDLFKLSLILIASLSDPRYAYVGSSYS